MNRGTVVDPSDLGIISLNSPSATEIYLLNLIWSRYNMSSTENPEPISIHISPTLKHLTIPLKEFLHNHPQYACLAVGAFIFAPAHQVTSSSPETTSSVSRLLIVQRAASEKSFPTLWEVPGGSSEHSDPTILHSVAREVFEETGLHLTRLVRQIGKGVEFSVGRSGGPERWLKLSFEVEVTEIGL